MMMVNIEIRGPESGLLHSYRTGFCTAPEKKAVALLRLEGSCLVYLGVKLRRSSSACSDLATIL